MLKKKLGIEGIERDWFWRKTLKNCFKIPSSLVIPEGCKRIGRNAFAICKGLEKVEIPESVTWIRDCAFQSCWYLKKVIIPKSMEEIGDYAFYGCPNADVVIMTSERKFNLGRLALNDCFTVSYVKEETRN